LGTLNNGPVTSTFSLLS